MARPELGQVAAQAPQVFGTPSENDTTQRRRLRHKLVAEAGLTLADIKLAKPSPTNAAYVNHMLKNASLHGLGATAAALLIQVVALSRPRNLLWGFYSNDSTGTVRQEPMTDTQGLR